MTLHTRLYNLLHTGNPGDQTFYQQCCTAGEHVLELGCGNGRIASALARQGCIVEGLDNDIAMVEAYSATFASGSQHPVCHHGDMRTFQLDKTFDKIIIPFNGLLCLLSTEDVAKTLERCGAHLKPGGELIFDVYYVPDDFENDGIEEDSYVDTAMLQDENIAIEVYEKTLSNRDPQRFDTSYVFVMNPHSALEKQTEFTVKQRCLYTPQIHQLLTAAGFEHISMTTDFLNLPISEDSEQIVVRARVSS